MITLIQWSSWPSSSRIFQAIWWHRNWSTLVQVMAWCHQAPSHCLKQCWLTHWGWVTHICVGKQTIIGSDNGLSPGWRQAIIWTNAGILLIGPLGTNFSEISIKIQIFSLTKMRFKVSSAKWRPFCLGLNVLIICEVPWYSPEGSNSTGNHQDITIEYVAKLHVLNYRQFSNIRRTQSPNIDISRLVLQLSWPNPLKPGVELRMKM